jgi:UDP-N-acetylmuramate dehydrogenase
MEIGNLIIQENVSLAKYHTFGIEINSKFFLELNSISAIDEFVQYYTEIPKPIYILGGGANSLFSKDFEGTIVHVYNKGIELIEENEESIFLRVQAGEDWDEFVQFCVENEYYGIENLSAIPGQVGTAPIQNIGAYGVEAKDCIFEVFYIDINDGEQYVLNNSECEFAYRDSIFKHELKDQIIVTEVIFKLFKNAELHLEYGAIKEELKRERIIQANISQISDVIRKIRGAKLPDPKEIGNAGSFFKNPVISLEKLHKLKEQYPNIVSFENGEGMIKIAAGWMIDYLGWKGKEHNGAAVHSQQALVLINKNNAQGKAVWELAQMIQDDVEKHFDIKLEAEVNII